jgi:hypothetical protein
MNSFTNLFVQYTLKGTNVYINLVIIAGLHWLFVHKFAQLFYK